MSVQLDTMHANYLVSTAEAFGNISLEHENKGFFVVDSNQLKTPISPINLSKELRGISTDELRKALDVGYLSLRKIGDEYALRFNVRMKGGGLGFAIFTYVATTGAGVALTLIGAATAPIGVGAPIAAAGVALVTAAPYTFAVTLPTPTP